MYHTQSPLDYEFVDQAHTIHTSTYKSSLTSWGIRARCAPIGRRLGTCAASWEGFFQEAPPVCAADKSTPLARPFLPPPIPLSTATPRSPRSAQQSHAGGGGGDGGKGRKRGYNIGIVIEFLWRGYRCCDLPGVRRGKITGLPQHELFCSGRAY